MIHQQEKKNEKEGDRKKKTKKKLTERERERERERVMQMKYKNTETDSSSQFCPDFTLITNISLYIVAFNCDEEYNVRTSHSPDKTKLLTVEIL